MSLIFPRYCLSKISNSQELFFLDKYGVSHLNEATALLINYLPVIGVPELNAENAEDAWLRIAAHQAHLGSLMVGSSGERWYLTRHDVLRHIGLETEGAHESIERFWAYLSRQRPGGDHDSPFVRVNGGRSLLSLVGICASDAP